MTFYEMVKSLENKWVCIWTIPLLASISEEPPSNIAIGRVQVFSDFLQVRDEEDQVMIIRSDMIWAIQECDPQLAEELESDRQQHKLRMELDAVFEQQSDE